MIHIENNKCRAEGSYSRLLADLAEAIETLYRNNFSKEDIMYAVNLGMKSDKAITAEMKAYKKLFEELIKLSEDEED